MANKQINELESILPSGGVEGDYLLPVYNTNSLSSERIKKATVSEALTPKWNPFTGTRTYPIPICRNVVQVSLIDVGAPESDQLAAVSADDFIVSVIHNDNPPYEYGIWRQGDGEFLDPQADPRDAVVNFDCVDYVNGNILLYIAVRDASNQYTKVLAYAIVQDNEGLCP